MAKKRALVLFSGGLDSMLVVSLLTRENIEVCALSFRTGFEIAHAKAKYLKTIADDESEKRASQLKVNYRLCDISDGYLSVLLNPKYGYGSAVNPCTDCHIYMLRNAAKIMREENFDFVATGEVLGQRPMSQKYHQLNAVCNDSTLGDLLFRPLSAALLPKTAVENNGWVSEKAILDIQGRSRNKQYALAKELGITDYPSSGGGGCFVVDKMYAKRFNDYLYYKSKESLRKEDLEFLFFGRHFRINEKASVAVGRDSHENEALKCFAAGRILIEPCYRRGPVCVIDFNNEVSEAEKEEITNEACILVAYYSKEETDFFEMKVIDGDSEKIITTKHLSKEERDKGNLYQNISEK